MANFNQEASDGLDAFEAWAKKQLISSPHLHADETGINIGGKGAWLHTLFNERVTWLHYDEKPGAAAMERMGILPSFKNNLIHDHWKPYFQYAAKHTLCNAHHLRELQWAVDFENQAWAQRMKDFLLEINAHEEDISLSQQSTYEERYRAILKAGDRYTNSPRGWASPIRFDMKGVELEHTIAIVEPGDHSNIKSLYLEGGATGYNSMRNVSAIGGDGTYATSAWSEQGGHSPRFRGIRAHYTSGLRSGSLPQSRR